jgi:hypothetical protein
MERLERDQDMQALAAAFNAAIRGRSRIVLVSGEAGVGKTSFVSLRFQQGRCRIFFGETATRSFASYLTVSSALARRPPAKVAS